MLEQIVEPLLGWFGEHARILPWREQPQPYRVWVSEIMLQNYNRELLLIIFSRFFLHTRFCFIFRNIFPVRV
jgi:A/G-specific adenine glycosylase